MADPFDLAQARDAAKDDALGDGDREARVADASADCFPASAGNG